MKLWAMKLMVFMRSNGLSVYISIHSRGGNHQLSESRYVGTMGPITSNESTDYFLPLKMRALPTFLPKREEASPMHTRVPVVSCLQVSLTDGCTPDHPRLQQKVILALRGSYAHLAQPLRNDDQLSSCVESSAAASDDDVEQITRSSASRYASSSRKVVVDDNSDESEHDLGKQVAETITNSKKSSQVMPYSRAGSRRSVLQFICSSCNLREQSFLYCHMRVLKAKYPS